MIIPAQTLRRLKPIDPFVERTIRNGMTFGLSPAGYELLAGSDGAGCPDRSGALAATSPRRQGLMIAHGFTIVDMETPEAAMAAFAKSWRREQAILTALLS
jgi:hypothetical protein